MGGKHNLICMHAPSKGPKAAFWRNIFGAEPHGAFVIIDPRVGQTNRRPGRAELRSIPMLLELGIKNFTFVDTLHKYELVDFNYKKLHGDQIEGNVFPMCQIISQETEFHSDYDVTRSLLNSQRSVEGSNLVLVLDSVSFVLKVNQDGKPMIEDWGLSGNTFKYEELFPRFLKEFGLDNSPLSFFETRNLVFHEMALQYVRELGKKPRRLSDLFDYNRIPTESYAWKILKDFANEKTQVAGNEHIHQCLRAWIEHDITHIADHMIDTLQRCEFDQGKIEKLRRGSSYKRRKM
jgi:hypothetical protein